jgi:hypothetical protein
MGTGFRTAYGATARQKSPTISNLPHPIAPTVVVRENRVGECSLLSHLRFN